MRAISRQRARCQGSAVVTVLVFIVIVSMLVFGTGTYTVSHNARAKVEGDYASAVDLAEAGINWELRRISTVGSPPDQWQDNGANPPGQGHVTMAPSREFWVYCTADADASPPPPWVPPTLNLTVVSTGVVDGVRRTIRASAKGYGSQGKYAIYGVGSVNLIGEPTVKGDVGTNGLMSITKPDNIQGTLVLNGPDAAGPVGAIHNPWPLVWPTVDQIAVDAFGDQGLAYVATHNDNATRADPPILNNRITGPVKITGPADIYVTSMNLTGNDQITFNNSAGPIRMWVGPSGGVGAALFRGTTDATTDPTKSGYPVNLYVATRSGLTMAGNSTVAVNIYAYNKDANGVAYGSVTNSGTPDVYGNVIAQNVDLYGNPGVDYIQEPHQPMNISYFGFDSSWVEVNPRL